MGWLMWIISPLNRLGPLTTKSKNLKVCVNFDVATYFLGPQLFGPPKCLWSSYHGCRYNRFQGLDVDDPNQSQKMFTGLPSLQEAGSSNWSGSVAKPFVLHSTYASGWLNILIQISCCCQAFCLFLMVWLLLQRPANIVALDIFWKRQPQPMILCSGLPSLQEVCSTKDPDRGCFRATWFARCNPLNNEYMPDTGQWILWYWIIFFSWNWLIQIIDIICQPKNFLDSPLCQGPA